MQHMPKDHLYGILRELRINIPQIADLLKLDRREDIAAWTHIVDSKLITRLSSDFPIMATICGGGSSGKSTLFNSLLGNNFSPVGGSAGINRRVLVSANPKLVDQKDIVSALFEPFGCVPDLLRDQQDLTTPGCPLYIMSENAPESLLLMDTPDFDTGAKGTYINRDVAKQALESSDILIYVFTNSNYNNRENTDFISDMLTGIGMRQCFLVYRTYPSFDKAEV
ncbi:MAG: dynamin family protein [Desulfobacterales bacterium]|nr:MAG: dynamin family protein [Desulfobacterales bacterium]